MSKITKDQIAEKDLFGDIGQSALSAEEKLSILEMTMENVADLAKEIKGKLSLVNPKDVQGIKEMNELSAKSNTLGKNRLKLQKEAEIQQQQILENNRKISKSIEEMTADVDGLKRQRTALNRAEKQGLVSAKEANKQRAKLNVEIKKSSKELNKLVKEELGLTTAIDKEKATLKDLIKQRENLSLAGKDNTRESRRLEKQIKQTSIAIDKAEKKTKRFKRGFGRLETQVRKVRSGMTRLAGAFGVALGLQGFARLIRNSFERIVEFQKANADLAAVLGKTRKEIKALTGDAKRLGGSTKFTASQVTGLQKEFAKLGFTTGEILGATEATLNLAVAANTELPRAAEVVGNTLRAFQLDTSETTRLVDLMTKSFNSSALDMEKFSTAMSVVAPVAQSAGFSLERTTAILGTLANNGVDASTAGTGLRNILLDLNKHGLTFNQAMQKINKSSNKTATAFDLFGKRGATVATIIAENTENISELNEELENAGGTAQKVADEQMDTLKGKMDEMSSAWEGFIFSMESGDGVISQVAKNVVGAITDVLQALTDLNKTSLDIMNEQVQAATAAGAEFGNVASTLEKETFAQVTKSVEELNAELAITAEASTGVFSDEEYLRIETYNQKIIDLKNQGLTDMEIKLQLIKDQQKGAFVFLSDDDRATRSLKDLNEELEKVRSNSEESIKNLQASIDATGGFESTARTGLRSIFGAEELEQDAAVRQSNERLQAQIDKRTQEVAQLSSDIAQIQAITEATNQQYRKLLETATDPEIDLILRTTQDADLRRIAELEKLNREQKDFNETVEDGGKKAKKTADDYNSRLKELQKLLRLNRIEAEKLVTENTESSDEQLQVLNQTGTMLQKQIDQIKELLKLKKRDIDADRLKIRLLTAELEAQRKLIAFNPTDASRDPSGAVFIDEAKIQRDLEIEKRKIRLEFIQLELEDKEKALLENFDKESKLFLDVQKLRLEAQTLENEIRSEEFAATQEQLLKEEQDLLIEFRDKKINGAFKTNKELVEAEKQLQKDLLDIKIEALRNEQFLLEESSLRFKEIEAEILELQQEQNDLDKKSVEEEQERYEQRTVFIDLFTQAFVRNADERIRKIDEEIEAAQRQANLLAGLAESGNITARESLAQQEQIIAEANRRREEEERRKQRILLVSSVLQAYNSELAAGTPQSEAFARAVTSTVVLEQFIAGLPTFFEGIENTGPQGQGVDGKGGFLSVLHPFERVVDAENNAALDGISNDQLARIVENHKAGRIVSGAEFMAAKHGGQEASPAMIAELKGIKDEIKDLPKVDVAIGEMTKAYAMLHVTKTHKNTRTTSSFKVEQ